jgi:hypothetical protein
MELGTVTEGRGNREVGISVNVVVYSAYLPVIGALNRYYPLAIVGIVATTEGIINYRCCVALRPSL